MTEPMAQSPGPTPGESELTIDYGDQRRWTVLLRFVLAIPQMVVFAFVSVAAAVFAIIGWFAALATGRLPLWVGEFLAGYVAWQTRLSAYLQLTTDRHPPFSFTAPEDYPVRIALAAPGPLNRAAVLFRFILLIPAIIITSVVTYGWYAISLIIWLVVLISGRMPSGLFLATAAGLRYGLRYQAYAMMLTSSYPKRLFGDAPAPEPPPEPPLTRPLALTSAARVWLIVFIVFGVLAYTGQTAANVTAANQQQAAGVTTQR